MSLNHNDIQHNNTIILENMALCKKIDMLCVVMSSAIMLCGAAPICPLWDILALSNIYRRGQWYYLQNFLHSTLQKQFYYYIKSFTSLRIKNFCQCRAY